MPRTPRSVTQVQETLTRRLKLKSPQFALEVYASKVSGSIISATFRRLRDSERQRRIWKALEAEYGDASAKRVGALLAFTPEEWDLGEEPDVVYGTPKGKAA